MKIYGFFNADSYQEVKWSLTVIIKYDNHGGGQAMLLTQGSDEVRDSLLRNIEHKLDLTRPDEITEKTRNKGYKLNFKYSNVRELQFHDLYSYMAF